MEGSGVRIYRFSVLTGTSSPMLNRRKAMNPQIHAMIRNGIRSPTAYELYSFINGCLVAGWASRFVHPLSH